MIENINSFEYILLGNKPERNPVSSCSILDQNTDHTCREARKLNANETSALEGPASIGYPL